MKNLLLALALLVSGITMAQDLNPRAYGSWVNMDGDILFIQTNDTFQRLGNDGRILAAGVIQKKDSLWHIIREDKTAIEYDLELYLGNETLVISKPGTNGRSVWLFRKVGN